MLNQLDSLAHNLEIARLKKLRLLRPLTELPQDCTRKHPSTRLMRPCRAKKQKHQATWLRRSRYVARDSNSRQRAFRCVTVCRRYYIPRILGGPFGRITLCIFDGTDAGQRDGAQQRYFRPKYYLNNCRRFSGHGCLSFHGKGAGYARYWLTRLGIQQNYLSHIVCVKLHLPHELRICTNIEILYMMKILGALFKASKNIQEG